MINPLNSTGANMHQVLMLTENNGIERVICLIQLDPLNAAFLELQKNPEGLEAAVKVIIFLHYFMIA